MTWLGDSALRSCRGRPPHAEWNRLLSAQTESTPGCSRPLHEHSPVPLSKTAVTPPQTHPPEIPLPHEPHFGGRSASLRWAACVARAWSAARLPRLPEAPSPLAPAWHSPKVWPALSCISPRRTELIHGVAPGGTCSQLGRAPLGTSHSAEPRSGRLSRMLERALQGLILHKRNVLENPDATGAPACELCQRLGTAELTRALNRAAIRKYGLGHGWAKDGRARPPGSSTRRAPFPADPAAQAAGFQYRSAHSESPAFPTHHLLA